MIKVGIVGATGYTGVELMRLLARHPGVQLQALTSRSEAGKPVSGFFPSLRGLVDLAYSEPGTRNLAGCDLVFFATPNGTAMQQARELLEKGIRIIDLSADFRLQNAAEWEKWYGQPHACPDLLKGAVYGLPEMNREQIRRARLVANPGCYPTAVQLGFLPLLENRLVDPASLIADAKSGVSGAGRKMALTYHYCEASDAFAAYAVDGHRHLPEIRQGLSAAAMAPVSLVFVPHLLPMIRGIHATLYATLIDASVDLQAVYERRYGGEPFVDVLPPGSHPNTNTVRGSNVCRIACHRPQNGNTAVILAVEDNLVKGAAGQAVQNMNIMYGLDETSGLLAAAVYP
jgi:N-acetyl-gamma-glutamyl-phosphate reductase